MAEETLRPRAILDRRHNETIEGRAKLLFRSARSRARRLGLPFTLTVKWIEKRLREGCSVTGEPFNLRCMDNPKGYRKPDSPSIDRLDYNKGYTEDNSRLVVWIYNQARGRFGDKALLYLSAKLLHQTHCS